VREPERQCIGCGRRGPQSGFLRLAMSGSAPSARIVVVRSEAQEGRGAYLCRRSACLDRAILRKAFQRAFRTSVVVSRDEIAQAMGSGSSEVPGRSNGG
jgi:predicted RNA-binding protein YlxR (DUF448 family)